MSSSARSMSTSSTTKSTSSARFAKFGIGGAGNYQPLESFSSQPSRPIVARTEGLFLTGIGGAGNARSFEQRAIVKSEQEEIQQRTLQRKNVSLNRHYGIGGAGNAMKRTTSSSSADSVASVSSHMSGADRLLGKVSRVFN